MEGWFTMKTKVYLIISIILITTFLSFYIWYFYNTNSSYLYLNEQDYDVLWREDVPTSLIETYKSVQVVLISPKNEIGFLRIKYDSINQFLITQLGISFILIIWFGFVAIKSLIGKENATVHKPV